MGCWISNTLRLIPTKSRMISRMNKTKKREYPIKCIFRLMIAELYLLHSPLLLLFLIIMTAILKHISYIITQVLVSSANSTTRSRLHSDVLGIQCMMMIIRNMTIMIIRNMIMMIREMIVMIRKTSSISITLPGLGV